MNVLFAGFDALDYPWLTKLAEELAKNGHAASFVSNILKAIPVPEQKTLPIFRLDVQPLASSRPKFIAALKKLGLTPFGEKCARAASKQKGELLFFPYYLSLWQNEYPRWLASCIEKFRPDIVVLGVGEPEVESAAKLCQSENLPYCYLLSPFYEFKTIIPIRDDRSCAKILVSGHVGAERVRHLNQTHGRVIFYGIGEESESINYESRRPEILLTLQHCAEEKVLEKYLREFVHEHSEITLRLRRHPSHVETQKSFGEQKSENVEFSSETSLSQDIGRAAVLCTCSSNSVLEAIRFSCPIIQWHNSILPPEVSFAWRGHALATSTRLELFSALEKYLFLDTAHDEWNKIHQGDYASYRFPNALPLADVLLEITTERKNTLRRANDVLS